MEDSSRRAIVLVTDAAMGTAVINEITAAEDGASWWSTAVLMRDPALITQIHRSHIAAGSRLILTATYQAFSTVPAAAFASPSGCRAVVSEQHTEAELREACRLAVEAAHNAIAEFHNQPPHNDVCIGGSVGPIGSAIPGAHEFVGDYVCDNVDIARAFFSGKLDALLSTQAIDYLVFETFPRLDEAVFALEVFRERRSSAVDQANRESRGAAAVAEQRRRVLRGAIVSFVTHDGVRTPCGAEIGSERFGAALAPFIRDGTLVGVGFNCSPPRAAERAALTLLSNPKGALPTAGVAPLVLWWKPNITAPHCGEGETSVEVQDTEFLVCSENVARAVASQLTTDYSSVDEGKPPVLFTQCWMGGCCGTGPAQIACLARLAARQLS